MKRPDRKEYIGSITKTELITDLEIYIDSLEKELKVIELVLVNMKMKIIMQEDNIENPLIIEQSKQLLDEYSDGFINWVKDNCVKKTNEVYTYKGSEYIYLRLAELYAKETDNK